MGALWQRGNGVTWCHYVMEWKITENVTEFSLRGDLNFEIGENPGL